ncbi:amino acid adenylation domain-containing protein, partial [Tenacibaculum sediminilitoris]|uniref:amino acid adenylation domain-containing protein n=1 Tax=Tenacibaculum sediminilitoris TaxID=1820334 RepID=UPI0038B668B1
MNVYSFLKELKSKEVQLNLDNGKLEIQAPEGVLTSKVVEQLKNYKEEIIDLLKQVNNEDSLFEIPVATKKEYYPLSFSQNRLWVLDQFEQVGTVFNMAMHYWLHGTIDTILFKRAFEILVERHEILRTRFVYEEGQPYQKILENTNEGISFENLDYSNNEKPYQSVQAKAQEITAAKFNLEKDPLLKVAIIKVSSERYFLSLCIHHIISDEWSMNVLVHDVIAIYSGLKKGEEANLQPLRIHFKDYASWELENIENENTSKQYWLKNLEGTLPVLELASDYTRPVIQTYNGNEISVKISKENSLQFRELLENQGATLFMGVMSLVYTLLYKYSGQDDIILGAPVSGRKHPDLEEQIGFYVNTLALRQKIDGESDFSELLQQVKKNILNGYQHQSYPFDLLVNELDVQRNPSRSPLFDVMVVVQDQEKEHATKLENVIIEEAPLEKKQSKYDFTFWFKENREGELSIQIEYNTDIYKEQTIQGLGKHLRKLLEKVIIENNIPLNELTLIDEKSIQKIEKFNETDIAFPQNDSILDLFKNQVEKTPNTIAVVIDDKKITYKELDEISNQLTHVLDIKNGTLVPICVDRSLEMIIGILAILKSGGAYVPIDPELPQSRISYIIENTETTFVLTEKKYADCFNIPHINLDNKSIYENQPTSPPSIEIKKSSLAYVIYTSGSTGKPKGVKIDHAGIYNRLLWMKEYLDISVNDNILQKTNFSFDVSVWELLLPLICGARLVFSKPLGHKDTKYLKEVIKEKNITLIHFVPTMLSAFLMELNEEDEINSLCNVICSGESLPANTVKQFQAKLPKVRLHNLYGPTEASIDVTAIDLTNHQQGKITIGKPIANTKIHIVDSKGNIQPIGVKGELLIAGVQVAKGYVNNKDLTEQKFIDNPFNREDTNKVYKTGDYAKWLSDGNIEFLGRIDNQIKLRGYRIELSEIESLLQENSSVNQAVVIVKEDFILGYVTGKETINIDCLIELLRSKLPKYMVPAHIQQLNEFPLTHSGKLDKSSLPIPEGISTKIYIAPKTETEKQIAAIWSELLLASQVGVEDDFFELGGNSIKAIQFITKLKKEASLHTSIETIFKNPVLKDLASQITTVQTEINIPKIEKQEDYELSKAQRGTWIQVQKQPNAPMFNIFNIYKLKGKLNRTALQEAFNQLIAYHESLRTIFVKKGVEPRQKIVSSKAYNFSVAFKQAHESAAVLQEFTNHIFDLNKGPLFKVTVVQNDANNQELYFSIHHIISDEWSMQILVRDLVTYYNGLVQGSEIDLTPLPIQYKDYAAWQTKMLNSTQFEASGNYWKNHLLEAPRIELASDRPRPEVMSNRGLQYNVKFSKEASEGLKGICVTSGSTLFMGVSALVYALLYRYTGQSDITLGTPIAGRIHEDLENQIGLYINTLALRAKFSGEDNFQKLLADVKEVSIAGFSHQSYPFDVLVEKLESDLQKNRAPLFDVVVILQNVELQFMKSLKMEGIEIEGKDIDLKVSKSDLRFEFIEREGQIECGIEYSTDLYDEDRIIRMGNHLENLLAEILATPEVSMKELTYLGEEELSTTDWFSKSVATVVPQYIHKNFENIVNQYPSQTALIDVNGETTYEALNKFSNQLSNLLVDVDISVGDSIGVLLPS